MLSKTDTIPEVKRETPEGMKTTQSIVFHAVAGANEIILAQSIDCITLSKEQALHLQGLLNEVLVEPPVEVPVEEIPVEVIEP